MNNRSQRKRPMVALLVEPSSDYTRRLLRGIMAFIREHQPWIICRGEYRRGRVIPVELERGECDGIIARIESEPVVRVIRQSRIPTVDVSSGRLIPTVPCMETDDAGIARLAAEHLLERGFKQFGFVGDDQFGWSRLRREHFQQQIAAAGFSCDIYPGADSNRGEGHWNLDQPRLLRWLRQLPKPVSIMAAWDGYGQQLLEACRICGAVVPDEVAVIGVDNDELECELSNPPLSSVDNNPRQIGYECAALLERMMAGKPVEPTLHVIPPIGVVTRQSTDVLAIDDPRISSAVRLIREQACLGIGVEDLLKTVRLSRRVLESRFRKQLGRSPHQEILRVQLQHVKQLLTETNLTLSDIAGRTGFDHQEYLSVVFKRIQKQTPGEYRKQFRQGS